MPILRQVGLNIRRLRLGLGLSQEDLAIEAKVAMNYVSGIERGAKNPTVRVLSRIAKVLRIPVGDLFIPVSSRERLPPNLPPGRRSQVDARTRKRKI
jgi:transcriptional regulator with XRE-family HTH domain